MRAFVLALLAGGAVGFSSSPSGPCDDGADALCSLSERSYCVKYTANASAADPMTCPDGWTHRPSHDECGVTASSDHQGKPHGWDCFSNNQYNTVSESECGDNWAPVFQCACSCDSDIPGCSVLAITAADPALSCLAANDELAAARLTALSCYEDWVSTKSNWLCGANAATGAVGGAPDTCAPGVTGYQPWDDCHAFPC
jgi:hypothetical protein